MPFKFHGGVHPNYMKAPDVPVTVIAPPPQVVLPVMQHIGAPCKPLVEVGDYVKMGQKIADNPAPVSAPIHATVSGKVIAIEPRPHPLGDMVPAIVIENDFQDTPCTDLAPLTPEQMKDPEAILERIREAGIVGHGGAMFPTAFKIRGGLGKVDTLIIGGGISAVGGMVYITTIAGCVWNHEGLSGVGWLAVALVIFCLWRPLSAIWGSVLFGALMILYLRLTIPFIPTQLYKILPYVVTLVVLIIVSLRKKREDQPPTSLGLNYFREDR